MINSELLQRFSRECLLLRQELRAGETLPEMDYRILKSNLQLLLAEIEQNRPKPNPSDKSTLRGLTL
jgi:hypothetical protein